MNDRCPYARCTMRNLCKTHCVGAELLKNGWRKTDDGDIEKVPSTDGETVRTTEKDGKCF